MQRVDSKCELHQFKMKARHKDAFYRLQVFRTLRRVSESLGRDTRTDPESELQELREAAMPPEVRQDD